MEKKQDQSRSVDFHHYIQGIDVCWADNVRFCLLVQYQFHHSVYDSDRDIAVVHSIQTLEKTLYPERTAL
jgi:hypothetical protein